MEAEITNTTPSNNPTYYDIRQGFVYERVPHITLKSIANNTEIDTEIKSYESECENGVPSEQLSTHTEPVCKFEW